MNTLCTATLGGALIGGMLSSSCASAQGEPALQTASPTALVDALNGVFGKQVHGRASRSVPVGPEHHRPHRWKPSWERALLPNSFSIT